MLSTKIYEDVATYNFVVKDTEKGVSFEYRWSKELPEGQDLTAYLQVCRQEAELLAQAEINKKALPQEIQI